MLGDGEDTPVPARHHGPVHHVSHGRPSGNLQHPLRLQGNGPAAPFRHGQRPVPDGDLPPLPHGSAQDGERGLPRPGDDGAVKAVILHGPQRNAQFPGDLPGDPPPCPGVHAVQFVSSQIYPPVIGRQGHGVRRSVKFMDAAEEDLLPAVIQQPHHVPHRHGQLQKVGVRRSDEHRGGETRRRLVPGFAQPHRFQRGHDHLLSDQQFHSVSTFPICSFRGFVTPFLAAMLPHFVPSP